MPKIAEAAQKILKMLPPWQQTVVCLLLVWGAAITVIFSSSPKRLLSEEMLRSQLRALEGDNQSKDPQELADALTLAALSRVG